MKDIVCAVLELLLVAVGFVLIIGTAGASDCGTISLTRAAVQGGIGLMLVAAGLVIEYIKEKGW